jgi:hypothetical protein
MSVLAAAAVLAGGLIAGGGQVAVAHDTLSVPNAPQAAKGALKQFDAAAGEVSCQTKGTGQPLGELEIKYDGATRSAIYTVTLRGAKPNTEFLLDVTECGKQGERLVRGDGGHLVTDAKGNGSLQGSWAVQSDAKWVKASLLATCLTPGETVPTVPCDPDGFASDALVPPGR